MSTRHRVVFALFVALSILAYAQAGPARAQAGRAQTESVCDPATNPGCADASKVGAAVDLALQTANQTGLSDLRLQKAVLSLQTSATVKEGYVLNFLIFTIRHQASKGQTTVQQITWAELPPPARTAEPASLKDALARAIASAAQVAGSVRALPLSSATITIKFAVDKTNGGGVSFQILGVSPEASADLNKVSENTLAVTFARVK